METTLKQMREQNPSLADAVSNAINTFRKKEHELGEFVKQHYYHVIGNLSMGITNPALYIDSLRVIRMHEERSTSL